jgi:hypothetical protein
VSPGRPSLRALVDRAVTLQLHGIAATIDRQQKSAPTADRSPIGYLTWRFVAVTLTVAVAGAFDNGNGNGFRIGIPADEV